VNDHSNWSLKSKNEMEQIYRLGANQFPKIEDTNELEKFAFLFQGLADETRLRIILILLIEDCCMCEIVSVLKAAASTISHHLKVMEKGGIITSRREGKFTIFSLNKEKLHPVLSYLIAEHSG
jgi:ArsR family transcriptional regulator, lead/cadmium/zinc/bismuth-responsive transcriptional repressor